MYWTKRIIFGLMVIGSMTMAPVYNVNAQPADSSDNTLIAKKSHHGGHHGRRHHGGRHHRSHWGRSGFGWGVYPYGSRYYDTRYRYYNDPYYYNGRPSGGVYFYYGK